MQGVGPLQTLVDQLPGFPAVVAAIRCPGRRHVHSPGLAGAHVDAMNVVVGPLQLLPGIAAIVGAHHTANFDAGEHLVRIAGRQAQVPDVGIPGGGVKTPGAGFGHRPESGALFPTFAAVPGAVDRGGLGAGVD